MTGEGMALVFGTLLAVGALAFVLYPLFFGTPHDSTARTADAVAPDSAIVALREIEFDRATGKLSDTDYTELRRTYTERALSELRAAASARDVDPVEARVRAYRAEHRECPTCGLRPEPDAIYCSSCGNYLDQVCPDCGAEVNEPGAVFCSTCGARLARAAVLAR
ncbi:MAG TPA: zinc ribbon domain-containing protein [Gemmatimonadaceae bacterium]|nr:zinc ribbon domain-containing protein [Gemmatimonadaceae bacterium]